MEPLAADEDIRGPQEPTSTTPRRRPGSVRRTCTVDMVWPDGLDAPLVLLGRGRDLRTPVATAEGGGPPEVLAVAGLEALVDPATTLVAITLDPDLAGGHDLVGRRVGPGFRSAADMLCATHDAGRSLVHQLLDDLPVATLISRFSTTRTTRTARGAGQRGAGRLRPVVDLCAGFQADGSLQTMITRHGRPPRLLGEPAPELRGDDPWDWPERPPLPPHGMRRARRLDLIPDGDHLLVDTMFRDSYQAPDGEEVLVHEYTLTARLDPATLVIEQIEATPRALPWRECPQAAASPPRLRGLPVHDLRAHVRSELTGVGTCTHLNDLLRSLADVAELAPATQR